MRAINLFLLLILASFCTHSEVTTTWPNLIVADENEVPVPGVSSSTSRVKVLEKVLSLPAGTYKILRPAATIKTTAPPPCPEPIICADPIVCPEIPDPIVCPDIPPTPDPEPCVPDGTGNCGGVPDPCPPGTVCPDPCPPGTVCPDPEPTALIQCPDNPTSVTNTRTWTLCEVKSSIVPGFTANTGSDYKMSYRVPVALTPDNKGQIYVYMHPSTSGTQFVTGSDSFTYTLPSGNKQLEIHLLEQTVGKTPEGVENSGGWWGWSGYDKEALDNYNGKQIVAAIQYILATHGDVVDINKGVKLAGVSLGGAGAYLQAQLLPPLGIDIASAVSFWGIQNIPEFSESKVKSVWGTKEQSPDAYAQVDLRLNWAAVQNTHFHWAGGQNDGLGRMSTDFMDVCELRKISCSMRWLQSGHGANETGYDLPSSLWLDKNQDATLDVILPVITNNTANHRGPLRGYINRNITWHHANIIDTVDEVQVPLKYLAAKNIGPELPDQPDSMTFSLTLRHVHNFATPVGREVDWVFGTQSGTTAVGGDGLLTVDLLTLENKTGYTNFIVTPHAGVVVVPPTGSLDGIVYSRVPRTTDTYSGTYNGEPYTVGNMDFMDSLPEVSRTASGFNAPGQLVIRDSSGVETIIFDCMEAVRPCVPTDPVVSLDGTKIAFTVFSAKSLKPPWPENRNYPNRQLSGGGDAQIHIYDIASQTTTTWPLITGVKDISPAWLPDGRIMFSSTRTKFYGPNLHQIGSESGKPRLYIADEDGSNVVDISQHELSGAIHPFLTSGGRVAFSSFWMSHNLPYGSNNGAINWPGTTGNMWVMMDIDREGGNITSLLGAHKSYMGGANSFDQTMKAMHFIGQRENEDLCTANYYRSNNLGLGSIICFPLEPKGVEGPAPSFVPRNHYSVATWSTSEDSQSLKKNGVYLGKVGWPEGTLDGQLMMSVGRGHCTQNASSVPGTSWAIGSGKGCDVGIYKTTVIPSTTPDDLELIVDDPNWHEFSARVIRSRTVQTPALSKTGDETCEVASSDAGSTDAHNYKGYKFNRNYSTAAGNGSEIDGLDHSEMTGIRFYEIIPNKTKAQSFKNGIGNKLKLLGDVPLLADKSFKAQLPCDTPYLMVGIDGEGRAVKRDQLAQSLRPGEKRVCGGCHLHSKEGRPYEQSLAFNATATPLLTATDVPTFTNDILPIFESRCTSCHTDDVPLTDYNKLAWDSLQKYVPADKKLQVSTKTGNKMFGLQRPYISKYVNNMYARESLLYWKAANNRTDGRTDETYTNDIDFGADHPTEITAIELKAVGDWLDSGATR